MLIHTGCTLVSLLPVIFSGGDAQRNGCSCLPLRPPQMSLGLPFNQCRLYPHMNFGLAAQSWHDNVPTRSFTVVILSPLPSLATEAELILHSLFRSCLFISRSLSSFHSFLYVICIIHPPWSPLQSPYLFQCVRLHSHYLYGSKPVRRARYRHESNAALPPFSIFPLPSPWRSYRKQ